MGDECPALPRGTRVRIGRRARATVGKRAMPTRVGVEVAARWPRACAYCWNPIETGGKMYLTRNGDGNKAWVHAACSHS